MSENGLRRALMERMMATGGKVRRFEVGGYADRGYESDAPAGDYGGYEGDNGSSYGNDTGTDSLGDSYSGGYGGYGGTSMGLDGMGGTSYGGTTGGTVGAGYGASGGTSMGFDGMGGTSYSNDSPNTGARAGDSGGWDPNYDFGDFSAFENPDNYDTGLAGTVDNGGAYDGMLGGFGGVGMGLSGLTGDGSPFSADHGAMANAASDVNVNPPDVPDTPTPGVDASAGLGAPTHEAALAELAANAMALPQPDVVNDVMNQSMERRSPTEGAISQVNLNNKVDDMARALVNLETYGQRPGYGWTDDLENPTKSYGIVGPAIKSGPHKGSRAYGASQVMDFNIPAFTKEYYGQQLTPKEYLDNPAAQNAVTRGAIMADLTNPGRGLGSSIKGFGYETDTPASVAHDWIGRGATDLGTGIRSQDYVSAFNDQYGDQAFGRNASAQVAGDTVPTNGLGSWDRSFEYAPANAPSAPAQAWDGIPEGDYTPDEETPASGLPTASEQYNMIDQVPMFAQPYAEPTYTREKATRPGSGPFGDEMAMTPYGAWQNTTLGFDPIDYGTVPVHEVPGPSLPGTQYAGDAVPTRGVAAPPATLATPAATPNGLPTSLDTGPLEAAHRARSQAYQGFNPDGTFPERGVVQQPANNPMFGPASKAIDIAAGLTPLGPLNSLAALAHAAGLPVNSLGGYTRDHAVPGLNISLGNELHQSDGMFNTAYGSGNLSKPVGGKTKTDGKVQSVPTPVLTDFSRTYTPPKDPLTYGYGPEQVMFKAKGGKVDLAKRVEHFKAVLGGDIDVLD